LEFVSLLLSKDMPNQASQTITQGTREMVGMGTFGSDKLHASLVTKELKEDHMKVARGWKVQGLTKTVDSILAAATRLEKEIDNETKYWKEVLSVSEKGWAVCHLPTDKNTLGVRFGFSESSPSFRNRSLAALRRKEDGSISLDQGLADATPRCLRVRIQVGGAFTGFSEIPAAAAEDAKVEAMILQARNTIFDDELWQELNREARTLGSLGIQSRGETLTYPLNPSQTMVLDLVPLPEESFTQNSGPDNDIACGIVLALRLLLCHAHRQNHRRRTVPPPPISSSKKVIPPYALLRSLITCLTHQNTITSLHTLLAPLTNMLHSASLAPKPTYTLLSANHHPPLISTLPTAEQTLMNLTTNLEATVTLTITPTYTIKIATQTPIHHISSFFHITVSDALQQICPTPGFVKTISLVNEYVYYATSCVMIELAKESGDWEETAQGNIVKLVEDAGMRNRQLFVSVGPIQAKPGDSSEKVDGVMMRAVWKDMGLGSRGSVKECKWFGRVGWDEDEREVAQGFREFVLDAAR